MKKKQIGIILILFFTLNKVIAQSNINNLIKEGIQYHDKGDYKKAIETYEKALGIDPKSALANYEIALSYFSNKNYEQAINHSDIVLNQNEKYMLQAYMTKGSALDLLGKTKESIKLFKKAIKKTKGHYLLNYNLALNYYKIDDLENAEENIISAIEQNSNHSSSHLLLAKIHNTKGNSVQTLLATYYFLFLEPNTTRSSEAYQLLQSNFGERSVSKNPDKPNAINITLTENKDTQFGAAELMISMLEVSKSLEENKGKTSDEMFLKKTDSFFTILGELKEDKNKEIWWTFYTTFFYDLTKSEHIETFCKYITQNKNETSQEWITKNEEKLINFGNWLKNH